MVARRRLKGFTLIELLISITILSLLVGLASYSFSLFSRHWTLPRANFARAAGQVQRLDLLSRTINDALPWIVKDNNGQPGFYFLGRDEGFTLVTASPIYAVGAPAVIRVFREPEGPGRWRLVYEEASLASVRLLRGAQNLPFERRLVVLEGLPAIAFRYYGWANLTERFASADFDVPPPPRWSAEFDGLLRIQQPRRVALQLGEFETVFAMSERTRILLRRVTTE